MNYKLSILLIMIICEINTAVYFDLFIFLILKRNTGIKCILTYLHRYQK